MTEPQQIIRASAADTREEGCAQSELASKHFDLKFSRRRLQALFCKWPTFGIPCGLIVYAGRNQFSHWDEKKPNKVTRAVFAALSDAFQDDPFSDLAFDLANPTINIYASEILLTALGWNTYDRYLAGMNDALWGVPRG